MFRYHLHPISGRLKQHLNRYPLYQAQHISQYHVKQDRYNCSPSHLLHNHHIRFLGLPQRCSFLLQSKNHGSVPFATSGMAFIHPSTGGKTSMSILAILPEPSVLGLRRYDAYLVTTPPTGIYKELRRVPGEPNVWVARFDDPSSFNIDANAVLYIGGSATEHMAAPPGHRVLLEGKVTNCK